MFSLISMPLLYNKVDATVCFQILFYSVGFLSYPCTIIRLSK